MSRRAASLGLLLALAACAGRGPGVPEPGASLDPGTGIATLLHASADAWNRGDLDAFLADYQDSAETTFVGASGIIRGTDHIRRLYRTAYWAEGRPEHRLRFDDLEVRPLGPGFALVLGRFTLSDPTSGHSASSGFFSLVLRRTDQGWKIIHDHSSASS